MSHLSLQQPYRTLEKYGRVLPEWVWVAWIPQLLTSLTRAEAYFTKTLLRMCAMKYPQSLYYTMRAFLLERRELPTDVPKHLVSQYQQAASQAVQQQRGYDPAMLQLSLNAAGAGGAANNAAGVGAATVGGANANGNGIAQAAAPAARAASAPQAVAVAAPVAAGVPPVAAPVAPAASAAAQLQRSSSVPPIMPSVNTAVAAAASPAVAAPGQFGLTLSYATGITHGSAGSSSSGSSTAQAPTVAAAAGVPVAAPAAAAAPAVVAAPVTSAIVPVASTASASSAAPPVAAAAAPAPAPAPAAMLPIPKMLTASNYTDDLMAVLRRAHPALGAEMETVLEEIIVHFRPEPEEELLSTVHALLVKCFQLAYSGADGPMMVTFKSTLAKVYKKFFNTPALQNSPRNKAFVAMYKTAFERDFVSDTCPTGLWFTAAAAAEAARTAAASAPGTAAAAAAQSAAKPLPMVIAALKKWKYLLHCRVRKGQTSCDVTLQSCSPYLAQLHCELETWNSCSQANIEIPGQYSTSYTELKPELHARLLRFHSQVL
jgi:hypothetical protein